MYYELYVDSLFFINFVMNLYLLLLVNSSSMRTATRIRLIAGAAVGAGMYVLPFVCNRLPILRAFPPWADSLLGIVMGTVLMVKIAFRVRTVKAFLKICEKMLLFSFFLGGGLLFIMRKLANVPGLTVGMFAVLLVGALLVLGFCSFREKREKQQYICKATLINQDVKMIVNGLIDSGNSLVEPISGEPVSIIEQKMFEELYGEREPLYRAIPYHSIGKKNGILKGYILPEIWIEVEGVRKMCKNIYVAVSEEDLCGSKESGDVRMIVNPQLLLRG